MVSSTGSNKNENNYGLENVDRVFHDFRSSLNIIIGYSELMIDEVLGKINEEQRDALKDILTSSCHLIDIINDITRRHTSVRP